MIARTYLKILFVTMLMTMSLFAMADGKSSDKPNPLANGSAILRLQSRDPLTKRMPSSLNMEVVYESGSLTATSCHYTGEFSLLFENYETGKVKEQEETIDALLGRKGPAYMPASVNGLADKKVSLKQNKPNPFNTTTIECTIPQDVASAFICVYDLQGKQVHRIDIQERGDVASVIDASYLSPGMYIYALIIDGFEIDSKRMIITD